MPGKKFNSLDDFTGFVSKTIKPWSKKKRTALAAAMAERWLPVYESFSEKDDWGNPATLEDAIQFAWNYVLGHKLIRKDLLLHYERVKKNTPNMDNCDSNEAISAAFMVSSALECCESTDNTSDAIMAIRSAFADFEPDRFIYPDEVALNAWRRVKVQKEIEKQLMLLKLIGDITPLDEKKIGTLRQKLTSRDLRGPLAPRPKRRRGLTNQAIFERYRSVIEPQLEKWPYTLPYPLQLMENDAGNVFVCWAFRYLQRKHVIERMIDVPGRDALVTRYSTHDAAVQGNPGWDGLARSTVMASYQIEGEYDANLPQEPHSYGPSFRRLCVEGRLPGTLHWARHRPHAWEEEDQRKKKQLAYAAPELRKRLRRKLSWRATGDVDDPWATEVAGETWRVRLNDFPDDLMYTLIINDAVIGKFHDWPGIWQR